MTLAALLLGAVALTPPQEDVKDYFPTAPGTTWTYRDTINKVESECEDKVLGSVTVEGVPTIAIHSRIDDRSFETTYYRIQNGEVILVAFDPKKPLKRPYPVLVLANGGTKNWSKDADTMIFDEVGEINMKCSATQLNQFEYKGERMPAIQVTIKGTVNLGPKSQVKSEQVAIYAKGIGLVRMRETGSFGKQKFVRMRELTSFVMGSNSEDK